MNKFSGFRLVLSSIYSSTFFVQYMHKKNTKFYMKETIKVIQIQRKNEMKKVNIQITTMNDLFTQAIDFGWNN